MLLITLINTNQVRALAAGGILPLTHESFKFVKFQFSQSFHKILPDLFLDHQYGLLFVDFASESTKYWKNLK